MSKQLFVVACLICACGRSKQTIGASDPARAAPGGIAPSTYEAEVSAPHASPVALGSAAQWAAAAPARPPGSKLTATTSERPSGLSLESDLLTYCDSRGGRALDLASGVDSARKRPCPTNEERNRACEGIDFVVSVREPGPDDIIDTKEGPSLAVNGHIHDCAFSDGVLLVATGQEVTAIDVKTHHSELKDKDGARQVAINVAWMAWTSGKDVYAQHR